MGQTTRKDNRFCLLAISQSPVGRSTKRSPGKTAEEGCEHSLYVSAVTSQGVNPKIPLLLSSRHLIYRNQQTICQSDCRLPHGSPALLYPKASPRKPNESLGSLRIIPVAMFANESFPAWATVDCYLVCQLTDFPKHHTFSRPNTHSAKLRSVD